MSEPIDDNALEEYLSRQSPLSKRYRALDHDDVPPELDRRVLAQAREAVADKTTRAPSRQLSAWMRWSAPFAVAASAVLAIAIVIRSGTQHEVMESPKVRMSAPEAAPPQSIENELPSLQRSEQLAISELKRERMDSSLADASASSQSADKSAPQAPPPAAFSAPPVVVTARKYVPQVYDSPLAITVLESDEEEELLAQEPDALESPATSLQKEGQTEEGRVVARAAAIPSPAQPAESAAGAADLEPVVITGSYIKQVAPPVGQGAGPRGTVPQARRGAASDDTADVAEHEDDPQQWLEHIRQLRKDGENRQADREWQRFRKAYPGYSVNEKDAARPAR